LKRLPRLFDIRLRDFHVSRRRAHVGLVPDQRRARLLSSVFCSRSASSFATVALAAASFSRLEESCFSCTINAA
jgi:hypothetical protein